MNNKNIALIIVIVLLLLIIISGIVLYVAVLSKQNAPKVTELKVDTTVLAFDFEEPFINNVNNSTKMSKVTIKMEVDKTIEPLVKSKEAELRDKINLLLRGKTEEAFAGPEGQIRLKEEVLDIVRKSLQTQKKVEIFISDLLVQ